MCKLPLLNDNVYKIKLSSSTILLVAYNSYNIYNKGLLGTLIYNIFYTLL
jgi:hypothetical protein